MFSKQFFMQASLPHDSSLKSVVKWCGCSLQNVSSLLLPYIVDRLSKEK